MPHIRLGLFGIGTVQPIAAPPVLVRFNETGRINVSLIWFGQGPGQCRRISSALKTSICGKAEPAILARFFRHA